MKVCNLSKTGTPTFAEANKRGNLHTNGTQAAETASHSFVLGCADLHWAAAAFTLGERT